MSEVEFATKLANKVLNDSSRDPDSDLSTLARQFLCSLEREERLQDDKQLIEAIAKAIGRTRTGLDADDSELCNASCETDGGTCICIELHYEQAQAALTVVQAELDRLRAQNARLRR